MSACPSRGLPGPFSCRPRRGSAWTRHTCQTGSAIAVNALVIARCLHLLGKLLFHVDGVGFKASSACVPGRTSRVSGRWDRRRRLNVVPCRSAVRVASNFAIQPHLYNEETEERAHHDHARHCRVVSGENVREAWVPQVAEGCRKQLFAHVLTHACKDKSAERAGRPTWTKAVAMSTPVPKCLQAKKTFSGTLNHLTLFAATGKPAPRMEAARTRTNRWSEYEILRGCVQRQNTYKGLEHAGAGRTPRPLHRHRIEACPCSVA